MHHLPHIADFISTPTTIEALEAAGQLLWIVTYILIIRIGFKHRSYGMPLVALCMNITWEFIHTILSPPTNTIVHVIFIAWLSLDAVILFQLFKYGREEQTNVELRRYFNIIVVLVLIAAFNGHLQFERYFNEPGGGAEAYLMNLVMSGLFIHMYFSRPNGRALSYAAAWTKLFGTALQGAGMQVKAIAGHNIEAYAFVTYLMVVIFILDMSFVLLLHGRRKRGADPPVATVQ